MDLTAEHVLVIPLGNHILVSTITYPLFDLVPFPGMNAIRVIQRQYQKART